MSVGVIPAAGSASRLQPLDRSKELLDVRGRPVMDHIVERMRRADCSEIRVVTRPDKEDVIEYVRSRDLTLVEGRPASLSESLSLGAAELDPEDTCLVGFPDTIWWPVDGFVRLLPMLSEVTDVVLGLFEFDEPERGDVVTIDGDRVLSIDVKPDEARGRWVWGCAVARARVLQTLDPEGDPGHDLHDLAQSGRVRGLKLSKDYIDIGTPSGLARALQGTSP